VVIVIKEVGMQHRTFLLFYGLELLENDFTYFAIFMLGFEFARLFFILWSVFFLFQITTVGVI
jgi:hypothetical protein